MRAYVFLFLYYLQTECGTKSILTKKIEKKKNLPTITVHMANMATILFLRIWLSAS